MPATVACQPTADPPRYRRREPETTVLYDVVRRHLATFLARTDADPDRGSLPPRVRRELERYLDCGILAKGFVRVHCDACRQDMLVAFSCKGRAVCPSCTGRRMAEARAVRKLGPRDSGARAPEESSVAVRESCASAELGALRAHRWPGFSLPAPWCDDDLAAHAARW